MHEFEINVFSSLIQPFSTCLSIQSDIFEMPNTHLMVWHSNMTCKVNTANSSFFLFIPYLYTHRQWDKRKQREGGRTTHKQSNFLFEQIQTSQLISAIDDHAKKAGTIPVLCTSAWIHYIQMRFRCVHAKHISGEGAARQQIEKITQLKKISKCKTCGGKDPLKSMKIAKPW